jgi:hypothetical protein
MHAGGMSSVDIEGDSTPIPDPFTDELGRDVAAVLNRHCVDSATNTPDFILADMVISHLQAFGKAVWRTASWRTSDA